MGRSDYTAITEVPSSLLTPDQMRRFAMRYSYARTIAHGKRLLEVACGAGSGLDYLAGSAAEVVGLDYTGSVLMQARHNSRVPLVQGDAQHLPFAGHFDLILCFEAIYYLAEYRRFLDESYRALVPGGTLLICQSNPDWPNFVPGALTTHYPTLPELTAALSQAGFHEVKCFGSMPISAATTRQRIINVARQWVTKSGILPWLGPLKSVLQRMSYGELHPLPPSIDAEWVATWQIGQEMTPISPTQPDRIHRVIYVEGRK